MSEHNQDLDLVILSLRARLHRLPTEDEVMGFIYGDKETRDAVWHQREFSVEGLCAR